MKMFDATADPCRYDVLFGSWLMVMVLLFDWTWNENSLRCMIVENMHIGKDMKFPILQLYLNFVPVKLYKPSWF